MKKNLENQAKTKPQRRPDRIQSLTPVLRFSPRAWAKLLFLRDYGETEVGGFGIAPAGDLLFVEDLQLVQQTCSWGHIAFDDQSVADFFDAQVDHGRRPSQFARLWLHTHPGNSPQPSFTDEETFDRVFGRADWAVMFILAREGQSYARLRFNVGPGGAMKISVNVDYGRPFAGCDRDAWEQEYLANVNPLVSQQTSAAEDFLGQADRRFDSEPAVNDPFFAGDQRDQWFGMWPDEAEFFPNEQTERFAYE